MEVQQENLKSGDGVLPEDGSNNENDGGRHRGERGRIAADRKRLQCESGKERNANRMKEKQRTRLNKKSE